MRWLKTHLVGGENWSLKAVLDFHKPAVALRTPHPPNK